MKILSNKKYMILNQEKNYYESKYLDILEKYSFIQEHYMKDEEIFDKVVNELYCFKSKIVGPISNTKIKKHIDKILKLLGAKTN